MSLLKNIASEDQAKYSFRQKVAQNRSIWVMCEDFKLLFNDVLSSVVVLQRTHYV